MPRLRPFGTEPSGTRRDPSRATRVAAATIYPDPGPSGRLGPRETSDPSPKQPYPATLSIAIARTYAPALVKAIAWLASMATIVSPGRARVRGWNGTGRTRFEPDPVPLTVNAA